MKKVEDKLRAMLEKRIMDSIDRLTEESSGGFVKLKPGAKWLDDEDWNKHLKAELAVMHAAAKAPPKGNMMRGGLAVKRAKLNVLTEDGRQMEVEWENPEFKVDVYYGQPAYYATVSGATAGLRLPAPADVDIRIGGRPDVDIRIGGRPVRMTESVSAPFGGPMNVSIGSADTSQSRLLAMLKTLREDGRPCPACDQSPCASDCKLAAKLAALEKP